MPDLHQTGAIRVAEARPVEEPPRPPALPVDAPVETTGHGDPVYRYSDAEPLNLGSGTEISIRELTELICDVCGFAGEIRWDATKPDGQPRRCLDTSRAERLLGWKAETPFDEGLQRTIAWYREQRKSERVVPSR